MADYQRILSYLYRYEKTEKKECLGFVKAEQKSGNLKLTIQIDDERLLQGMELKLCFYERQGESWQVWQMDSVVAQEHKEELHLTYSVDTLPKGFRIRGQSGVLLYYQESFYYGTVWIGEEIPAEVLEPLRWHKVGESQKSEREAEEKDSKKDMSDEKSEKQIEVEENILEEKLEKQTELEKDNSSNMSKKQEISAKDMSEEVLEESKKSIENISGRMSEGQNGETENISGEILEEQVEAEKDISQKNIEVISLERETILEKNNQINEETLEKDSCKDTEKKIDNRVPEKKLSDTENNVINSDGTNIEENIKIKEFSPEPLVDDFEKMWINSAREKPPVDNIFNTAFYEGCKVSAAELEQFGEEAGSLKSNQFLLKGYERYHHLLMGKVRYAGEKRYCVGVPGIYENREKYMADIYQFPVFLSLTENRMKTGGFGYWLYLLRDRV